MQTVKFANISALQTFVQLQYTQHIWAPSQENAIIYMPLHLPAARPVLVQPFMDCLGTKDSSCDKED